MVDSCSAAPVPTKARPFRLIDQIESRDGKVWNQFPIERQRQFRTVIPDNRGRGLIDAVGMGLQRECQTERSRIPIQKPVAQIHGNTLPGQLAAILKTRNAVDVMSRKGAPHLDPEIPGRHELQFEFLVDRPVMTATFGKSSGRLALEFAFAGVADIGTDHEAK